MHGTPTAAQIEAVRRATWAERAVRDGVIHADQAAEIMLSGLGTLLADLFDDLTDFTRNDIKARKLQNEKILEASRASFSLGIAGRNHLRIATWVALD